METIKNAFLVIDAILLFATVIIFGDAEEAELMLSFCFRICHFTASIGPREASKRGLCKIPVFASTDGF